MTHRQTGKVTTVTGIEVELAVPQTLAEFNMLLRSGMYDTTDLLKLAGITLPPPDGTPRAEPGTPKE